MAIRKYKVTYINQYLTCSFSLVVEIDSELFSEATEELFDSHGINKTLDDEEKIEELLRKLGCHVFKMSTQGQSQESIIREFQVGEDGWPQMDGSWGIKIVSTNNPEFEADDFDAVEIEGKL